MNAALYIIDGFGLIFRSYYAHIRQPLRYKGRNTSAIHGFFGTFFSLLHRYAPGYCAIAWDAPGDTFRHRMYADYKAHRDATPEDLISQIGHILDILKELHVPVLMSEGYEADDVIATLCNRFSTELSCYVVSADKDLLQLVGNMVTQLKPRSDSNFQQMDRDAVFETMQVYPEQIVDFLSITGDSSDNIPGVAGIGKVGAAKLLREYGTLEEIYKNLDQIREKIRDKLSDSRENAKLSSSLVQLAMDVPLGIDTLDELQLETVNIANAQESFSKHGIRSLLTEFIPKLEEIGYRVENFANSGDKAAAADIPGQTAALLPANAPSDSAAVSPSDNDRASLEQRAAQSTYDCIRNMDEFLPWVEQIRSAGVFALDSETDSLDAMRAVPVGFSLSLPDGKACYIPLLGPEGAGFPEEELRAALRLLVEDQSLKMVCQNAKYDIKVLCNWGIRVKNLYFDTMLAAWMLNSDAHNYNMDTLARQYLSYDPLSFNVLLKACGVRSFEQIPLDLATFYAAEDADITMRLYQVFSKQLGEQGLEEIFYKLEIPLIDVLVDMEMTGICLDTDILSTQAQEITASIAAVQEQIFELCGHPFNVNSPRQLQDIMFKERGLTPLRKVKSGFSTDNNVLQQLATQDPLPGLILRYRMLNKLKSSYIDTLPEMIHPGTQRIHTHYIQSGAATGRLASKDPNLQNIPVKNEEGKRIRSAFYADKGKIFVSADYSQIELIVLAHFSQDPALLDAFRNRQDIHEQTAILLFGDLQVSAEQRRIAKSINFGVIYGMSAFRLSNELSIPRKDAAQFIDRYFLRYSQVRSFIDKSIQRARAEGYVTTLMGRRRYVSAIQSKNYNLRSMGERVALNTIIQGSAADIIKHAMLRVANTLPEVEPDAQLVLQIHDELIVECPADRKTAVETCLVEAMVGAMPLSVPLVVHTTTGSSWGDL